MHTQNIHTVCYLPHCKIKATIPAPTTALYMSILVVCYLMNCCCGRMIQQKGNIIIKSTVSDRIWDISIKFVCFFFFLLLVRLRWCFVIQFARIKFLENLWWLNVYEYINFFYLFTRHLDLNSEYLELGFGRGGPLSAASRAKRMRTSFKHHQLRTMKSYFAINHNPDAKDLKQLSQKTGLPKRVLQVSIRAFEFS